MIPRSSTDKILLFALALLTIVGVLYSTFLLSLTMFGLILLSQLKVERRGGSFKISRALKGSDYKNMVFHNWKLLMISLLFFMVLLSYFNSENQEEWYKIAVLKLPFLVVPLALSSYPDFTFADRRNIILMLSSILVLSSLPVLWNYGINYEVYTEQLGKGIPIPTPLNHIKYSLLIAFVSCGLLVLLLDGRYTINKLKGGKIIAWVLFVFMFLFLHILAVRTGLMALYLGLVLIIIYAMIKYRPLRKILMIGFILLSILGIALFKFVPSIQHKIGYTLYDLNKYQELDDASNYSLAARLYSYDAGIKLFISSPVIGVGVGDVKSKMKKMYDEELGIKQGTQYPHNQYLLTAVRMGGIAFVIFILAIYLPFTPLRYRSDLLVWVFLAIMTAAFLVDNILERASSVAYFIYLYTLLYKTKIAMSRDDVHVNN